MDFSLCERDGLVFTPDALAVGASYRDVTRAVRNGHLLRLRRGCYVRTEVWDAAGARERHLLRVRSVVRMAEHPVVLAGASAAAIWAAPLEDFPVEVTVIDTWRGGGRSEPGVRRTARGATSAHSVERDGYRCTTLARTVLEVSRELDFRRAVPILDWALSDRNPNRIGRAELAGEAARMGLPARQSRAVTFANGESGSEGESEARAVIHELGFPSPQLQRRFVDEQGEIFTDFYWERFDVVVEFDGKLKYTRDRYTAGDPSEVVWREKKREDRLRRQVRTVVRVTTYEVKRPQLLAERLLEAGIRRSG